MLTYCADNGYMGFHGLGSWKWWMEIYTTKIILIEMPYTYIIIASIDSLLIYLQAVSSTSIIARYITIFYL